MKKLALDPPKGPIYAKYVDARDNDEFPELGVVGPVATAKSTMMVDRTLRRGSEYPGSNILIARATLTSLKDSTIMKMRQRIGVAFDSENLQEAIFRLPKVTHPVTGNPVESIVKGIGLDRSDLEQVLKSTEYSTVVLEEANEIASEAHDMVQIRSRQRIYHVSKKVYHLCMKLAARWSLNAPRTLTPEDVYQILLDDPRNPVGQDQLEYDHPMPGQTVVAAIWNPVGNDHTWARYVGVPYPAPRPVEGWVEKNVGVREVHVDPPELIEDRFEFQAGSLVKLPDGGRAYAAKDLQAGGVKLIDGTIVPREQAGLIVQRYCIYVFAHENESRDYRNVENTYLMANRDLRKRHQHGELDVRMGRIFHNFINDYVKVGGHVLPYPGKERLAKSGYRVVAGIDQGGAHATAIVMGIYAPTTETLIIFDEYVRNNASSKASAYDAQAMMLPGNEHLWGYDPAMEARIFDEDADKRIIDNYIDVLGDNVLPGARGDAAYDEVVQLLDIHDTFIGSQPMPKLIVFDNCYQARETLEKLTWKMIRHQRNNWMVDVGDAIKIMVSMVQRGFVNYQVLAEDSQPQLAYSENFKEL